MDEAEGVSNQNDNKDARARALDVVSKQAIAGYGEVWQRVRDLANAFTNAMEPMRLQIQEALASAATLGTEIASNARALGDVLGPALMHFVEGLRQLPPQFREKLLRLGQHGWYLDPQLTLPAVWDLAEAFEQGRGAEADSAMAEYFRTKLSEIEKLLTKLVPARAKLIRSAFVAHRRSEFDLSIPVLLAQTDGICVDATGGSLFRDEHGSPHTAAYVRSITGDELLAAMLAPLAEKLPINATEKQRREVVSWTALNRHMVLHGEALDYGTEINSLKAISLLNYVASVLLSRGSDDCAGPDRNDPPSCEGNRPTGNDQPA